MSIHRCPGSIVIASNNPVSGTSDKILLIFRLVVQSEEALRWEEKHEFVCIRRYPLFKCLGQLKRRQSCRETLGADWVLTVSFKYINCRNVGKGRKWCKIRACGTTHARMVIVTHTTIIKLSSWFFKHSVFQHLTIQTKLTMNIAS